MFHIVIPARLGSTRLPNKALADIGGRPMLWHVCQRALSCDAASVTVATDDQRIADALRDSAVQTVMTSREHRSGTDRLAEVVNHYRWSDDTIVVNLQGDEPQMPPANLQQVASLLHEHTHADISTLWAPITDESEFMDPAVVKIVVSHDQRALYFSRAPIPYPRDTTLTDGAVTDARRHIGLYAYRAGFLRRFSALPPSSLERLESLEQLRALDAGSIIVAARAASPVPAGVDTPADLDRVRSDMEG